MDEPGAPGRQATTWPRPHPRHPRHPRRPRRTARSVARSVPACPARPTALTWEAGWLCTWMWGMYGCLMRTLSKLRRWLRTSLIVVMCFRMGWTAPSLSSAMCLMVRSWSAGMVSGVWRMSSRSCRLSRTRPGATPAAAWEYGNTGTCTQGLRRRRRCRAVGDEGDGGDGGDGGGGDAEGCGGSGSGRRERAARVPGEFTWPCGAALPTSTPASACAGAVSRFRFRPFAFGSDPEPSGADIVGAARRHRSALPAPASQRN